MIIDIIRRAMLVAATGGMLFLIWAGSYRLMADCGYRDRPFDKIVAMFAAFVTVPIALIFAMISTGLLRVIIWVMTGA